MAEELVETREQEAASPSTLAIGQGRIVVIWKLVEYTGQALFIVIVPRVMGPDLYGGFALLLSVVGLLTIVSTLGALATLGRFVPEYETGRERARTRALFMQLFCLRSLASLLLVVIFLFIFPLLLPGVSSLVVAAGAAAFLAGAIAAICYQLFYGLNALGKWLSQDALARPALLFLLLLIFWSGRESLEWATLALLVTQLGFLMVGVFWARSFFTLDRLAFHGPSLFSHLRFGLSFFAANVLLMAMWRGGEALVAAFSPEIAEVAFFNVANSVAFAFSALIGELTVILTPSLTTLHLLGKEDQMNGWLAYSLKYLTIVSFLFLFAVYALGEWLVGRILGEQYLPVVDNLKMFAIGLLPLAFVRTGISLATVYKQPRKVLWVTAAALATFVLASALLIPHAGSYGAASAIALALACAAVITYYQFPLAPVLSQARFWPLVLLGLLASGILFLPHLASIPSGMLALAIYVVLLFLGRVISTREIRQISQARRTSRG
jgi:O-antigen/teichoic acid export membrane protein